MPTAASTMEGVLTSLSSRDPGSEPTKRARFFGRLIFEAAAILALSLTLNLAGNGRISLWDRDEPRYAGCTREMRARGDWLYPTFNGEPRFHKPILIYWLMRGGYALGGDNPFGARLVSAAAGALTSLLVLMMGRRMVGERAGFLAALMLTTAPIMVIESKLATTDATLTLFLVGCQFCVWELGRRSSRRVALTFWSLLALATLTKGPVGIALIACSAVSARWWGGPSPAWGRLHWRIGVPLFLAMIAPWYVVVGVISQGEFFRFALGKQIAERMLTGMEQHGGIPGYYILTSLVTFHPWSALLPAALFAAWGRRRERPEFAFLLGWVVGPLVLLECVQTKLVHYYLPAYPACALLTAWLVVGLMREEVNIRRWPPGRLGLGLLGGVGIGTSAVFAAGTIVLPPILRWPCLTTAVIVAAGTLWGMLELQRGATERATFGLAAAWGLAMVTISAWLLPNAEPYRTPRLVGECLARLSDQYHLAPVLLSYQEPSVVYAMGRPAPLIRTWEQFYDQLDRHKAVVSALIPIELAEFLRRDHLHVSILETIEGFNLNKGQSQLLRFAVIRRKDPSNTARPDSVASNEKLLVK